MDVITNDKLRTYFEEYDVKSTDSPEVKLMKMNVQDAIIDTLDLLGIKVIGVNVVDEEVSQ